MFERFTDRARKVMQFANRAAIECNHEYVGTEHILLGLLEVTEERIYKALFEMGVDSRRDLEAAVRARLQQGSDPAMKGKLPQTPRGKKVIEYAMDEARDMNHNYVGIEHLLLGLIRESDGVAAQVLRDFGVEIGPARKTVLQLCSDEISREAFEQERHENNLKLQNHLWQALQIFDIRINDLDREVFDAAFLESDWDRDAQRDRAMHPDFQPPIRIFRDEKLVERNSLARMLSMEERRPHDLAPRDYHRREVRWAVECPIKVSRTS